MVFLLQVDETFLGKPIDFNAVGKANMMESNLSWPSEYAALESGNPHYRPTDN